MFAHTVVRSLASVALREIFVTLFIALCCFLCVSFQMVLHYFLADDTIEVLEVFPNNSGRDNVPTFLQRGRLPKVVEPVKRPGEIADRTVLNVFGPSGHGGRYILDSLKVNCA